MSQQTVNQLLTGNANKGTCGAGETPLLKLHYQIRLSGYAAVCDDQHTHAHQQLIGMLKLPAGICAPATAWLASRI